MYQKYPGMGVQIITNGDESQKNNNVQILQPNRIVAIQNKAITNYKIRKIN